MINKEKYRIWTEEEIKILKKYGSIKSNKELQKLFFNRSVRSINSKLSKLKIKKQGRIFTKKIKWDKKEINILKKYSANKTNKELQKILFNKVKYKRNLGSIQAEMYVLGIKKDIDVRQKINQGRCKINQLLTLDDIDTDTCQVFYGSILGDACIVKLNLKYKTKGGKINDYGFVYNFKELHGQKQKEYVEWKRKMLSIFKPSKLYKFKKKIIKDDGSIEIKKGYYFQTGSHPIFKDTYYKIYRKVRYRNEEKGFWYKKRRIPLEWMRKLDYLGLLIWYLDDGTYTSSIMNISTKSLNEKDLIESVKIINKKLNLSLYLDGKNRIFINNENARKLLIIFNNLFNKYNIPDYMRYKIKGIDKDGNIRMRFEKFKDKCSSKYRGVIWCKRKNEWRCRVYISDNKEIWGGYFSDEKEAAMVHDKLVIENNLSKRKLNFPRLFYNL